MLFLFLLKFSLLNLIIIFIRAHRKAIAASVVYAMGGISVSVLRPSVSHSGIMSKWRNAEGCSLYHG